MISGLKQSTTANTGFTLRAIRCLALPATLRYATGS